jgi:predicted MPP superfamily phosphohydrolase
MFLLNELLILSPVIVYVCLRIRKLIARRLLKNLFTVLFVLLVLGFPVAETLSHNDGTGWTKYLISAGYYSLPLLLYLSLAVILSDLAVGAVRLLKIIPKEAVRQTGFRLTRLGFVLTIPVVIVVLGVLNYRYLRVKEYSIEVPRKSSSLRQLKIVFAADFHLGEITPAHFMEKFVAKVNAQNPDIVLIGGDVLEGDRRDEETDRYEAQFRQIKSKYGVYGAPGNHEGHRRSGGDFFGQAGIRLLQDEVEKIDAAFYLAGRKDKRSRDRKSIDELLRNTSNDLPVILLDHRPTDLEKVSQSIVDIQLSGHTHHGQLFPLNFITKHEYELSWGYKKKRQTHIFVTSGAGLWGPPVRTAGASEILVIKVAFRDKS